jgi:hypothetical protein
VTTEATSGKRVVGILLGIVLIVALVAWIAAIQLEKRRSAKPLLDPEQSASVISEGILYEARPGDVALVVAKDVASGKELWRAELGSVAAKPVLVVHERVIEVQIAGTSWMKLDRTTGESVE